MTTHDIARPRRAAAPDPFPMKRFIFRSLITNTLAPTAVVKPGGDIIPEEPMRFRFLFLCALIAAPTFAQQNSAPEIPYDSVPNFIKLPPDLYLGEVSGVALNSKGHIFIYTRSGETLLLEFDAAGKFLRRI